MTDSLQHRGPDAGGAWFAPPRAPQTHAAADNTSTDHGQPSPATPGVALGHRRLSIIDVGGSAQPLGNEDQSIQIVFNGEIYNYRELRRQLLAAGHQFRTEGDTEVIVHLYEEHGLDFVRHLRGMFALAIWDARLNHLVLARDRMGKKPLYYRLEEGRFSFASELKGLLQIPDIQRHRSNSALLQFLTLQYVPHPHCILQGFSELPPGARLQCWKTAGWNCEAGGTLHGTSPIGVCVPLPIARTNCGKRSQKLSACGLKAKFRSAFFPAESIPRSSAA
ncbi:MAG UNVERIFIED_CONTAM: hypothetical protein LVR18_48100 [Planctomycetaceae bacterium]